MIRPVYIYGSPVLRKVAQDITPEHPGLKEIIVDMFETMEQSDGIGLAAPQIGLSIRLFVIDGSPLAEDEPKLKDFRKAFINAHILERFGDISTYNEGCLSIPGLHEDVDRETKIRMRYCDENFVEHEEVFDGMAARIIQHEHDHLDGILFTDRVSPIRRQLLKSRLNAIARGKLSVGYKYKLAK